MPTKDELRARLIDKLKELFQLDRPELDFGLYRIMHAKDEEVTDYLENGLPKTLKEALGKVNEEKIEERKREYEEELQTAKDYGAENPEEADRVQEAKRKYEAAKESANADKKVYDHLYRFFSRYYEKGDFITRRYRVRETDTQAAPYAIPYNGEEVKLHWANADQYYIKTAEHFRNFRFNLREAVEEMADENMPDFDLSDDDALPVHFRVVEGKEGEHDNVKDKDSKVRKLKPHTPNLLEVTASGELVVNFEVIFQKSQGEYIYDDEMEERLEDEYGTSVGKSDKEPLAVAETVFDHLGDLEELDSVYKSLLSYVPPPDNKATPPLLAQYYEKFADKHEMDYFIHKDLGGFLRRELDFYIKNEVMRLDDVQRAEVPRVESYLDIVKALRRVAHDIIGFLAQLEDFQKKLWLKKKFVVDTGYCVTLDHVPESLYDSILGNNDQLEEWRDLYAVDEWEDGLFNQGYEDGSFSRAFLEAHPHLMIDTRHFGSAFTNRLLSHLGAQTDGGLAEAVDGRCVQSENFQALHLLRERYQEQVDCIYTDPPYNTGNDDFLYKDTYRHSSWLSMMTDRLRAIHPLLRTSGLISLSVDDNEQHRLHQLLVNLLGEDQHLATLAVQSNPRGRHLEEHIASSHEYALTFTKRNEEAAVYRQPLTEEQRAEYNKSDREGSYRLLGLRKRGAYSTKEERPNLHFPIYYGPDDDRVSVEPFEGAVEVIPKLSDGTDGVWRWSKEKIKDENKLLTGKIVQGREEWDIFQKDYLDEENSRRKYKTLWADKNVNYERGKREIRDLFSDAVYDTVKPLGLVERICHLGGTDRDTFLDPFAGSGTTGHAVMGINGDGEIEGNDREYLLIEMGDYFDTVMLPRLKKVAFSDVWDDGVPESRDGQSHVLKYHRLESYEDTLNNLELNRDEDRQQVLEQNEDLRRDYRLHYMLDVETEGSPSLLDIDEFTDPRQYHLQVKKPGSDASTQTSVDLPETFNYLLGLRVEQIDVPETFTADFHRPEDPELPEDERTRLEIDGEMEPDEDGDWWFRTVTGWVPSDPMNPDDSDRERVLIIWRTLTDDREQDNTFRTYALEGRTWVGSDRYARTASRIIAVFDS